MPLLSLLLAFFVLSVLAMGLPVASSEWTASIMATAFMMANVSSVPSTSTGVMPDAADAEEEESREDGSGNESAGDRGLDESASDRVSTVA